MISKFCIIFFFGAGRNKEYIKFKNYFIESLNMKIFIVINTILKMINNNKIKSL